MACEGSVNLLVLPSAAFFASNSMERKRISFTVIHCIHVQPYAQRSRLNNVESWCRQIILTSKHLYRACTALHIHVPAQRMTTCGIGSINATPRGAFCSTALQAPWSDLVRYTALSAVWCSAQRPITRSEGAPGVSCVIGWFQGPAPERSFRQLPHRQSGIFCTEPGITATITEGTTWPERPQTCRENPFKSSSR
jgi:hypothetical protein